MAPDETPDQPLHPRPLFSDNEPPRRIQMVRPQSSSDDQFVWQHVALSTDTRKSPWRSNFKGETTDAPLAALASELVARFRALEQAAEPLVREHLGPLQAMAVKVARG